MWRRLQGFGCIAFMGASTSVAAPLTDADMARIEQSILHDLEAIRTSEKAYYHEWGEFMAAPKAPSKMSDSAQGLPFGHAFGDNGAWDKLGWLPPGNVYAQYEIRVTGNKGLPSYDFLVRAYADLDGDGIVAVYEATKDKKAYKVVPR